ncbi:hypothetical protein [Cryptosporangium sp. NPDC051539]|uniref:hypothetical protein n=1 Tax=Cryptosporangium sp. NPDC051539 TaxID=3363962 RepID=UPI003788E290
MRPDPDFDWHSTLRAATESVRSSPFADLSAARAGIELSRHAAIVAKPDGLTAAARWIAITETVIAVADDLDFFANDQTPAIALPQTSPPETVELLADLHQLWTAINDGLQRYLLSAADQWAISCAVVTTRSLLKLIEAGAGARP